MLFYIIKRLIGAVMTVFIIATVTFFAMHLVPGDPLMKAKAISPEVRANLEKKYGFDKPLIVQYQVYLKNIVRGDFGISFTQENRSVNEIIKEHFPVSAVLGLLALFIAASGGILFGALTATFRNKAPDRVVMFFVILCVSVPNFVFAAVGQYLVSELNKFFGYSVLPVAGWGTFRHMILPSIILGVASMAFLTRLMRSSMLEVVHQDYIRTAKAKGVSRLSIFLNHQMRNAILPVITYLGPTIAFITTGGFVAEMMFAVPGMGRYFIQAVQQLDYTVIMGLTVFYSAYLVLMVIAVDIIYGFIDPRIRITG